MEKIDLGGDEKMNQYSRPSVVEYACDFAEIGKYRWVKFRGEHTCSYCGAELKEEWEIHKRIEWKYSLNVSSANR